MRCPSQLPNEAERLRALVDYGLDDERMVPSLDPVVRIAARMFDMPVAAVNMIGSDHVFFAASTGVGEVDMDRDVSFCAHAITQDQVMVVPDATQDDRFHDNPLVLGPTNLRFYAGVPLLSAEGLPLGALCIIDDQPHQDFSEEDRERLRELARMATDRLELRRIEVSAERKRPAFESYAGHSDTPVLWFDHRGHILAWNPAAADLLGYAPEEGAGLPVEALLAVAERPPFLALIRRAVTAGYLADLSTPTTLKGLHKDGSEFDLGLSLFSWSEKGYPRFEAVLSDNSQRQQEEAELRRLATFDALTGLANRGCFYRRAEEALLAAEPVTVLMIDLDGFKDVNDTLGHLIGDGILREVANRLAAIAGPSDLVARIGGDEFALLLTGITQPESALLVAHNAISNIAQPILVDGHEVRVAASCGLALAPLHALEALELVGDADLALFKAKGVGRSQVAAFTPELRMEAVSRHLHAMELHRAVENREFVLFYQPQVRLSDGSLRGAEALIRWQHPERGLLPPAAFLPALEGGPLAASVGSWILDEACAQLAFWRNNGAEDIRMGVNLFSAQFRVGDLVTEVLEALARYGLPPESLELEVTENIVLDNDDIVLETLQRLRAHGVGIAFDDFGTGYASLILLKTYPLSRIKIDRSFVQGILESRRDASVVRAILDMARSFDLETIAEGIESEAQRARLKLERCGEGQGYLFSRPMSAQAFTEAYNIRLPVRTGS